ncbi:MAG: HAD family hydrolase [Bacteroidales bacterium]|nr:HAD family hydrolase [Bacteroidales bacterium]
MAKLAIFDLDGTLLNTLEDLAVAANLALRACGCPEHELEKYKKFVGRGIHNMLHDALPADRNGEEMIERASEVFYPYYNAHNCDLTCPYPGIIDMLTKLDAAGVRMAVASNKYQAGAESVVGHYFGQFSFVKILGQADGRPIKPSPEIVGEVMRELPRLTKEDVVYVGDSNVDMQTGRNAGVRTVGVTWGFRSREEMAACDPWKIVDSPDELTECILAD